MCLVCDRIELIRQNNNPYFVKELSTGYVVIGDYQHFKGYTLFLCKEHAIELFQLEESFRMQYMKEMDIVAQAVYNAFKPEKLHIELLGNTETHLHWHIFPRNDGDLEEHGKRGPVWWYPGDKMYAEQNKPTAEELKEMNNKLLAELDKLL